MRKIFLLLAFITVLSSCKGRETAVGTSGPPGQQQKKAQTAEQTTIGTDIGATMPAYSATWMDGSKFDLASKRDKVVLLNLWATWCGPCREEIPDLQALHDKYAPKGFEVIGVSVDENGIEPVKQFVQEFKMTYPVALDPEGKLAGIFQTSVLPTSVLLDRTGKIVWKQYGLIMKGDEELLKAIEKAL